MDHALLVVSLFCFLIGFAYTMYSLGARVYRPWRGNLVAIACGFLLQTGFLALRGQRFGRCPLSSFFEMFIFLSWSVVLLYLLIGPIYRVSLMGAFTSPLAFVLQAFALLAINDAPVRSQSHPNPWLELHAAISVVAYGAFALAAVAGVMYLVQERKLKTHHLGTIFFNMPPIADLAAVINRLLWAGSALLTVGILSGFAVGAPPLKIAWGVGVWFIYSAILLAEKLRRISPRRVAILSVATFAVTLATLWGINFIGANGRL